MSYYIELIKMEEKTREKLVEAIGIIAESQELLKVALNPISSDISKGELLEKLYYHLTERKLFKYKTELAQFAIDHQLSPLAKSTLANGGVIRVIFEAFRASKEDLEIAVNKLSMMESIKSKTKAIKPKHKSKSRLPSKKIESWGNILREHHLPKDE